MLSILLEMGGVPYIQSILKADKSWGKEWAFGSDGGEVCFPDSSRKAGLPSLFHSIVPWGERPRPLTSSQVTWFSPRAMGLPCGQSGARPLHQGSFKGKRSKSSLTASRAQKKPGLG